MEIETSLSLYSQVRSHLLAPLVATRRDEPPRTLLYVVFIGKLRDTDNETPTIIITHSHIHNQSIARSVRFFVAMGIGNKLRVSFLSCIRMLHRRILYSPLVPLVQQVTDMKRLQEQARDGLSDANALTKCAEDRGGMMSMGYNYPAEQVDMIVVNRSQILGLGYLGIHGMVL
ncbi:hypothetical protein F2Q70_00015796 [Brassica cretica]|uniref:Uncharacterized protein n=1 Tax=Brassica cretica TaxID=69181 RepID=A0A8S9HYL8_BRACR|nr:hypothetical protein F2Q70_00015796 [Brassica cretica]